MLTWTHYKTGDIKHGKNEFREVLIIDDTG